MLRRFALTLLLATATTVVSASQPGEARRNRAEAVIPPLPPVPLAALPADDRPAAILAAAEEIDDQAQVVELAAPLPQPHAAAAPFWSIDVTVDAATRCALGPAGGCLANDERLRAAGIVLDPDDPSVPPAAPPATAPRARAASAAGPALGRAGAAPAAPPRPRAAALRAVTPELVPAPAAAPAPAFPPPRRAPEPSGVVAPMQWRIAPAAYLDLQPGTEVSHARGEAARAPTGPADGGPPIPGAARLRVGISVPLEAFRTAARPVDVVPPPGP